VSVSLCLLLKWKTSMGMLVQSKSPSPITSTWRCNLQLESKMKYSGVDSGIGKVALASSYMISVSLWQIGTIFTDINRCNTFRSIHWTMEQNVPTWAHYQLLIVSPASPKTSSQMTVTTFRFSIITSSSNDVAGSLDTELAGIVTLDLFNFSHSWKIAFTRL
jgi:hypothetical protein